MKTTNKTSNLALLAAYLLISGDGFSITKTGAAVNTGYSVATAGNEEAFKKPSTLAEIAEKIQEYMDYFEPQKNEFYGGWYNRENGLVYLDISERFENLEEAKDAGSERKQLAIFDLENLETITL